MNLARRVRLDRLEAICRRSGCYPAGGTLCRRDYIVCSEADEEPAIPETPEVCPLCKRRTDVHVLRFVGPAETCDRL